MRVLLIEDEFGVGDVVSAYLARTGRKVEWVRSFADGQTALNARSHDMLLVDLRLPDGNGLDIVGRLRDSGDQRPIIIITAQDQIRDRIKGLNAGADDYIVKPFNLGEMEARMDAVQRRASGNASARIVVGEVRIDTARQIVTLGGVNVAMSKSEWALLKRLCSPPGQSVSKADLQCSLIQFDEKDGGNAVEVYISRLRRKLGHGVIENQRGIGYRLAV